MFLLSEITLSVPTLKEKKKKEEEEALVFVYSPCIFTHILAHLVNKNVPNTVSTYSALLYPLERKPIYFINTV